MHNYYTMLAGVIAFLASVGSAWRYVISPTYKVFRRIDASAKFSYDMATNHLPHIYHAQQKICSKLGVELDEPQPVIRYGGDDEGSKEQ